MSPLGAIGSIVAGRSLENPNTITSTGMIRTAPRRQESSKPGTTGRTGPAAQAQGNGPCDAEAPPDDL
jgi:hypothetical protein